MKRGLSTAVRAARNLEVAWRTVKQRGSLSTSRSTRAAIARFDRDSHSRLDSLARELRSGHFRFAPAEGVPIRRSGKSDRPIVVAEVRDRIVRRAILNVLQRQSSVKDRVDSPTSFGAVSGPRAGVRPALETALRSIESGSQWYLKTDISDFYCKIPRAFALQKLLRGIHDIDFCNLVSLATIVELKNVELLGPKSELFPTPEVGVAQGYCLSPLLGNALLREFDQGMNGRGVVCLRYVDDLLFLADQPSRLQSTFASAQRVLQPLGLSLYEAGSPKYELKRTTEGLTYLGCEIKYGAALPAEESRRRLMATLESLLNEGHRPQNSGQSSSAIQPSVREVLGRVHHVVEGWGKQYSYCNCSSIFAALDNRIDEMVNSFLVRSGWRPGLGTARDRRRVLGVHELASGPMHPIVKAGWLAA